MKKIRSLFYVLAFLSLSAIAFAIVTPEQVKNAILGVKTGVMVFVGNCEGKDQYRVQELLTLIRGCQMTEADSTSVIWNKQKYCIDVLTHKWESIEQVQCKTPLQRPIERLLVKNLLQQWDWVATSTEGKVLETRTNKYLEHLSYWENKTRNSLYLATDVSEAEGLDEPYQDLSQDLNEVHAQMAKGLFNSMRASISDFNEFQTKKFMEKEAPFYLVMKGLLEQDEPGPISLINFTAMTLNPLLERAKVFLTLFDLTCSLKGSCRHEDYAYSESYLVLLLTSFIGESTLDGPILKDSQNRLHPGVVKNIFETLFQNRAKLTQALRVGMTNQQISISEASLEQFEPLALYFISQLKETNQLLQTVRKTGRFVLVDKEYLGPFTQEGLDQVNQVLHRLKTSLDTKLTRYNENTKEQLNALQNINDLVNIKENTASQLDSIRLELNMAEMDLQGLQTALRREGDTLSKLILRSSHLISDEAYQNRFSSGNLSPMFSSKFNVSAEEANFTPVGTPADIASLALAKEAGKTLRMSLKKGDLISAEIMGQYSPTCAIAREYTGIKLEGTLTGPEGFIVSSSDRHIRASSATQTSGDRQSAISTDQHIQHLTGCGSASTGSSISMSAGVSLVASASVSISNSQSFSRPEDCTDKITSKTKATEISQMNSTTSSSEFNQQASFERGMRSIFTPFPTLPAGALVAVELDSATNQVLNTHVLHRNSVFSATQDADLVLVVNDCKNEFAHRSQLGVKLVQNRSAQTQSAVGFLMESIAIISAELQRRLPVFIEQGELSSSDLAVIERDLRVQLNEQLISGRFGALQISDFPLIEEMFQTWISKELAQLQRKVKIRQIERKIQLLVLKHNDLVNQSLNLNRSHIIREMISDSAFRSLDFRELLAEVLRVVEFLDYRVLPVLETVKPGLAKSVSNEFNLFVHSIDLNTDLQSVSRNLLNLVDSLDFAQALQIRTRTQNSDRLVISFPRTAPRGEGEKAKYHEEVTDGKREYRSDSVWPAVSYMEANRVWHDFLNAKTELSFNITVKDIYKPNLFGSLKCSQSAPFVSAMSVFFVGDQDQHMQAFNGVGPRLPILLPDVVNIPNLSGMDSYRVTSEAFRSDIIPIRLTTSMQVYRIFDESRAARQEAARGVSPIGTFTLQNMKDFYQNQLVQPFLDQIDEILLVFQYDSLSSGTPLGWIPGCH